jgi:hypothetical protein
MQLKESSHSPHKKNGGELSVNGVNDFQSLTFKNQKQAVFSNPKQSLEAAITSQEINVNDKSSVNSRNVVMEQQKGTDGPEAGDDQNTRQQMFRQKLNKSRQLMAVNRKLSSVLEASPLKNSYLGRIFHDRYQSHLQQPDGSLTLASILNETLSKLKGRRPNKAIL